MISRANVPARKLNFFNSMVWGFFNNKQTNYFQCLLFRPKHVFEDCCINFYKDENICKGITEPF